MRKEEAKFMPIYSKNAECWMLILIEIQFNWVLAISLAKSKVHELIRRVRNCGNIQHEKYIYIENWKSIY